jgi:phosphoribosylformylglycinamidine cyclo-ligase
MENKKLTYEEAGVSIDKGNESVEKMKPFVKETFRKEVLTDLGGFGGLFALNKDKYEEPVLVSGTDGVGTKLKVAFAMNKHDSIGIDAVAMCVNDIIVTGAEPLFFLDYLAVGKLEPDQVTQIVKGVAEGCKQAGCALIGGETAEMPGFYPEGEYDVAGFAVGIVDKKKIINGKNIQEGDIILGLPSSGLHSNGFSLARKVLFEKGFLQTDSYLEGMGTSLGNLLIEPTKIYVKTLLQLIEAAEIKGLAHITGGGLVENVPRVLPEGLCAEIESETFPKPGIFEFIQNIGEIEDEEMYRVFNMGIGMVIIADKKNGEIITEKCKAIGEEIYTIGKIIKGNKTIIK